MTPPFLVFRYLRVESEAAMAEKKTEEAAQAVLPSADRRRAGAT